MIGRRRSQSVWRCGGNRAPAPLVPPASPRSNCDPSYPDVCIPPYSKVGDLDCGDVSFKNILVVGSDPHGFDGRDQDGIGWKAEAASARLRYLLLTRKVTILSCHAMRGSAMTRRDWALLCVIVVFAAAARLVFLDSPPGLVLDEFWYARGRLLLLAGLRRGVRLDEPRGAGRDVIR